QQRPRILGSILAKRCLEGVRAVFVLAVTLRSVAMIARFVVVSGCIFDVVEVELVFAGGCNGCAGVGAAALEALVTVAVGVFSPQSAPTRAASKLSTSSSRSTDSTFWSVTNSASTASGMVLSSSILSSNRTLISACMGWSRFGHQRQPLPEGSQLLPKSRPLCDTTKIL